MNEGKAITFTTLAQGILFIVFLLFLFYIRDLVLIVLAAIVIASAVEPAVIWFGKFKIKRLPAAVGVYIIIGLFLAGVFLFFLPSVVNEAATYLDNIPDNISVGDLWRPIQGLGGIDSGSVNDSITSKDVSIKEAVSSLKSLIPGSGKGVFETASLVFGGALSFVLIIVLSFYFSVQENGVSNFLRLITPVKTHQYVVDLWKRSKRKIGYWLQGQFLLAIIVGVLVYLGLMIFGVPHALLLATLAALFEVIPVFGPILASIPAIIIAVVDGGATLAFLVIGLYVVIQQFENHLLYPLVVQKIIGVSPIIVILALVIGAKLAGILGALLAVPISAAIMEYIGDIERRRKAVREGMI
jgi:predicted PurR-regulated permease PerM